MPIGLIIGLSIGTVAMMIPIIIQCIFGKVKIYKGIITAFVLTAVGTAGTYLMFYIEAGYFKGTSFYGAVFFVPMVFAVLPYVIRERYSVIMDLCGPAECAMLAVMKIQCYREGCCGGRILSVDELGNAIQFPSQIVEVVVALLICIALMILVAKKKMIGKIYPMYMLIYGCIRFFLSFMRAEHGPFAIGLPAGSFWSLISVIIGALWISYPAIKSRYLRNKV